MNQIQDENKELKLRCNELKSKCQGMTRSKDYKLWDVEDVVDWIIELDEKYSKYKQDLISNLINEQIDGSCLSMLEVNDLHRLGITNFKDKKQVYQSIQQLIHDQK